MAHQLSMDKVQTIQHLRSLGWSQRQIAESLGIDRKAVRRHLRGHEPKGTKAPPGSDAAADAASATAENVPSVVERSMAVR